MNRRHPIDEIFRHGLGSRSEETPMYLWDNIERQRSAARRGLWLRRFRTGIAILTVAVAGALLWSLWPAEASLLGFFPVPQEESRTLKEPGITRPAFGLPSDRPASQNKNIQESYPPDRQRGRISDATLPPATTSDGSSDLPGPAPHRPDQLALMGTQPSGADAAVVQNQIAPKAAPAFRLKRLPGRHPGLVDDRVPDLQLFLHDPKCARFNRVYWRTSLELAVSPDWNVRTLTARDSEYEGYLRARDESETTTLGFSAAARFSAVSNFGLALRSGLHYAQINERFEYRNENEERIIITNIYGSDGQITGTDTIVETGARHKVTHNRYQLIDIPLIIGYERQFKKVGLSINGGALLNLLFRQKGDFLSPYSLEPVNFSTENDHAYPAFRDRLSVSWYGSLGLTYRLNGGVSLLLEPHLRINPHSFTRNNYPLDQRYLTGGIFVGLRKAI